MDENNNYETIKEQDSEFLEKEHSAGFHDKFQEGCSTCYRENRFLKAKALMDRPFSVGRIMTRIVWGDDIADSGWVDPSYK